jgi:uncharacterized protein (TIGR01777 family)
MQRLFVRRTRLEATADEAYRWHARPGAFERLSPPWDRPTVESSRGAFEEARVVLRLPPLGLRWVAEHHSAQPGRAFHDRQLRGPFASWDHAHRMEPDGAEACWLEDRIEYTLPGGALGDRVGDGLVRRQLARMFAYRHRVTADDLAAHTRCRGGQAMKVAITGASGLIGSALGPFLTTGGHALVRLVRRPPRGADEALWDPAAGTVDPAALSGVDAVVHLAGESIAEGRWSESRKARLRESRLGPTRLLCETLAGLEPRPKVLVSASAIGYYGDHGAEVVTETTPAAGDFLGRLAAEWEEATLPARRAGIRVVNLRTGIVLSPEGGALGKMLLPFKAGLGGVLGPGTQYMSWIGIDDLVGAIHHALLTPALDGPVNAVAPAPVTNRVFTQTLGRLLHRPTLAAVPAFALRLAFGEMADAALLSSTRVAPERLLATGYRFRFPELEGALRHLLGRVEA